MKVINRNLNREYSIVEKYEAGVALTGAEVRSVKEGNIKLDNAYVKIFGNEVHLINAEVAIYKYARPETYDPRRTRKLLLHKREILRLTTKIASGGNLTIVPVSCYNKKGLVKVEIALAKGKKIWEKKSIEKERDVKRQTEKELKEYIKK